MEIEMNKIKCYGVQVNTKEIFNKYFYFNGEERENIDEELGAVIKKYRPLCCLQMFNNDPVHDVFLYSKKEEAEKASRYFKMYLSDVTLLKDTILIDPKVLRTK